jgi:3-hydroxyacyl-CoA dehydrogenase
MAREDVAIVGAGNVGWAWAIVFAAAEHHVRLQDVASERLASALESITDRLEALQEFGLLTGPAKSVLARVSTTCDLGEAVAGAAYIQECIPEDLGQKQRLFELLASMADWHAVIASSSSFIPASAMAAHVAGRERCLIVHPGNPPYLLRVAEVVPAPFTAAHTVEQAERLLTAADMKPIRLAKEINGFVFNRLQGAILREAYALVRDGIARPDEIDSLVRDGLALRWSVVGPFETTDLNASGGIAVHAERMLPVYARMGAERGEREQAWPPHVIERVVADRRRALPLEEWRQRVAWRDRELMSLLADRQVRQAKSN